MKFEYLCWPIKKIEKIIRVELGENYKQLQLILLWFKSDGATNSGTFVDFLIVIKSSYIQTKFNKVNNDLGMDQDNSRITFSGSFVQGTVLLI